MGFKDNLQAFVLENGAIYGMATIRWYLVPFGDKNSFVEQIAVGVAGSLFTVEMLMLIHMLYAEHVYSEIPYFSKTPYQYKKGILDTVIMWFHCNLTANIVAMLILLPAIINTPDEEYNLKLTSEFHFLPFLGKLALMRLIVDVVFYVVHRALHTKHLYWVHKNHHSHTTCHAVSTNLSFHWIDLILEGFIPVAISLFVFEYLGISCTKYEEFLFFAHIIWFETGSHAGKELPTVSYFPILSLITRPLGLEKHNVLFHDNHHFYNNCNYGITQWCDVLMSSRNVKASPR